MSAPLETYRGAASPWECDVTEHFTLAFYFDRIAMAEASLAERLGLLDTLRAGGFTRRYDVRLAREQHAGSAFHIESAPLDAEGALRASAIESSIRRPARSPPGSMCTGTASTHRRQASDWAPGRARNSSRCPSRRISPV
jgi:hypothetical protein